MLKTTIFVFFKLLYLIKSKMHIITNVIINFTINLCTCKEKKHYEINHDVPYFESLILVLSC